MVGEWGGYYEFDLTHEKRGVDEQIMIHTLFYEMRSRTQWVRSIFSPLPVGNRKGI